MSETLNWHKSTFSQGNANDCVEVADSAPGVTKFRDTKLADSPIITVGDSTWGAFLTLVK